MSSSPLRLATDCSVNTANAENKTIAARSSCQLQEGHFHFSHSSKQIMGEVSAFLYSWGKRSSSCSGRILRELHE